MAETIFVQAVQIVQAVQVVQTVTDVQTISPPSILHRDVGEETGGGLNGAERLNVLNDSNASFYYLDPPNIPVAIADCLIAFPISKISSVRMQQEIFAASAKLLLPKFYLRPGIPNSL
jgi:hypothetical protein